MATPQYGHPPIAMRLVDGYNYEQRGDFNWKVEDGKRSLVVAIPCQNNKIGGWVLSEWTIDHKNNSDAQWSWDGNEKSPTLTPSLHAKGVWHGYVKKGMLVEA